MKTLRILIFILSALAFNMSVFADWQQDYKKAKSAKNYKKAMEIALAEANKGNAVAMYSVGLMNEKGE